MRKKLRIYFLSVFILLAFAVKAQEVMLPLFKQVQKPAAKNLKLAKSAVNFPVIDYFINNGAPNQQFWADSNVQIQNRFAVFNAQDAFNNTYSGANSLADVLTLRAANLLSANEYFISFNLYTGNTFSAGDSLLVQITDANGNFVTVYNTQGNAFFNSEVVISFLPGQILLTGFRMRFMLYTANFSMVNNQTFLLSNVVFSQKNKAPLFNVLSPFNISDSTADGLFFNGPDAQVISGNRADFVWGNVVNLNMRNTLGLPYAASGYGGGDTFNLNPVNVFNYAPNDSIIFSFVVGSAANLQPGDSLIIEFKNNLGNWIRMVEIGAPINGFINYSFNINWSRFRFANFTARFVNKGNYADTNALKWFVSGFSINSVLRLPFIDDFSNTKGFWPNTEKWVDNNVFINNDFPFAQPSINVATFDGLDANGNAYSRFIVKGIADVLTSKPFNLTRFEPKDSLILSMYYQYEPQGSTNQVFPDDSLYIELKTTALGIDSFVIVKAISAGDVKLFKFNRVDVVLDNPRYFNREFQFRIKNRGSLTGNLSHWHIDYVIFNNGRKLGDRINDVALTNTPNIYLGKYFSMPWKHYSANKAKYGNDTVSLRLRNHHDQNYAVDYFRYVIKPEGDTLDKFNNIQPTLFANSDTIVRFNKPVVFTTNATTDSFAFRVNYRIRVSGTANDEITTNDTASVYTVFDNFMAYDDGTAEGGYGIKNKLNVGACLKYNVEVPDTLYGLYVFFNQSEQDISTQRFNIRVWKHISPLFQQATSDQVMYSREYRGPIFTNYINGFATLVIDPPLAVTDSFFVGWDQANAFVLNIGLDKNYPFGLNKNHFYRMDGRWYPTEIPGALMIRPILGKFKTWPTNTSEILKPLPLQLQVFPNPAKDKLQVFMPDNQLEYNYQLFDLSGRLVQNGVTENKFIYLQSGLAGLYVLHLNQLNQQHFVKIIIEP